MPERRDHAHEAHAALDEAGLTSAEFLILSLEDLEPDAELVETWSLFQTR